MKKNKILFASGLRRYVVNTMWNHMLNIRIKRNIQVLLSSLSSVLPEAQGRERVVEKIGFSPTRVLTAN